ncbi:DSS1/SEM1 family-domain-containing protein [Chytridium lagenaria]|nr:DSS1/SEM1 family-domain-containing protein [Chytridium lagenaria]
MTDHKQQQQQQQQQGMVTEAPKQLKQFNDFEDDDEFEDFGLNEWNPTQEDATDADLWVEDWDAEDMSDEFTIQLRAELQKPTAAAREPSSSETMQE